MSFFVKYLKKNIYLSFQKPGAKAVLQFYPENDKQCQTIMKEANRAGFFGGLLIDNQNIKKIKK